MSVENEHGKSTFVTINKKTGVCEFFEILFCLESK